MSEPSKKPNYISSSPSGEDLFEGKSHEKISNTIFELIKEKSLPNNVVGIEGKWGSGKSNVVSILNKKFNKIKDFELLVRNPALVSQHFGNKGGVSYS